jgi:hypothetical protein
VIVGVTTNGFATDPVFQTYPAAPVAVNVAAAPPQIEAELTVTTGIGLTVTKATALAVQPAVFPVTV